MNKLPYAVDPAISVHPYAGDGARLRRLATSRNVNVTNLLRDIIRRYLDEIDTAPNETPDLELEDVTAPSVALGHVDPDDDDLDGCVANLIHGGHRL